MQNPWREIFQEGCCFYPDLPKYDYASMRYYKLVYHSAVNDSIHILNWKRIHLCVNQNEWLGPLRERLYLFYLHLLF